MFGTDTPWRIDEGDAPDAAADSAPRTPRREGLCVNFARVFRGLVQRHGNRDALINVERNRRYSFAELHRVSNRIANMMRTSLRLGPGDRYLLILRNDNLSLLHFWTVMKCEAAAVFTNFGEVPAEHVRQVDFVRPKCVFVESDRLAEYYAAFESRGVTVVAMDGVAESCPGALDFWKLVDAASDSDPVCELDCNQHPAFYRFTGGTTGIPKCAEYAYRHFEQCWRVWVDSDDGVFSPATRFLHFAPLSHGTILFVAPTFFSGGCNITQNGPDLALWCDTVERYRATASFFVPTLLYRLLLQQGIADRDLGSLVALIYGAAPMSGAKLAELQQRFGNVFLQIYAATESFGIVTRLSKTDHLGAAAALLESCGRAVTGTEIMVADDHGKELPAGEIGELWHRHAGVIARYFDNDAATAGEFCNGWWKSGDLARMDAEGYVFIVDRKKDVIVTGGFNVYAVEVEAALSSHPAVLNCAVVGAPHPEWGEAVLAEVVLRPGVSVQPEELIQHAKKVIGSYKAPKSVCFVDSLPVSAAGKVLRKDVRDKYWKERARRV